MTEKNEYTALRETESEGNPESAERDRKKPSMQGVEPVREDRLERMIRQARDGKTAQKAAFAANGAHLDVDGAAPLERWKPSHFRQRPPKPPHNDSGCKTDREEHPHGGRRRGRRRLGRLTRKLIGATVLLALIIVSILIFWPRLQEALTPNFAVSLPDSLQGLLPDEKMGYNAVDFSNAILGESREQKELVVMEQDVEVTSQISQDLLNIALFAKQKTIHSFGTGVYTVNLETLRAADIALNENTGIITVTIPHAKLSYVGMDVEKTEFEDTQKALLAVGDIKLTAEQKHVLDQSVDTALRERLGDPALLTKADEIALNKVREIFQAPVSALSEAYIVKVVMA